MNRIFVLTAALILVACGNGERDDPSAATIADLERTGKLPVLDRSADLKGPDANTNGVCDDIERWIDAQPYSAAQKKAALQSAKALQDSLFVPTTDPAQFLRGDTCV